MVKKEPRVWSHAMLRSLGFMLFGINSREPVSKLNLKKGTFKFQQDHSNNSVEID